MSRSTRSAVSPAASFGEHDAEQRAAAELHGGLLELGGQHLAEPLEAAHLDFRARFELALDQRLAMLLVAGVERLGALRQPVERRQREKEMPAADELRHLAIEEGEEQRGDVGAVNIGVGHHDDLVVAQIRLAVARARAAAQAPAGDR